MRRTNPRWQRDPPAIRLSGGRVPVGSRCVITVTTNNCRATLEGSTLPRAVTSMVVVPGVSGVIVSVSPDAVTAATAGFEDVAV